MKFDKYVKMVGTMGTIASYKGHKYLCYGGMIVRIPEGITGLVCAAATELPKAFQSVLDDGEGEMAELVDAFLPYANDKSSEVRRVFADKELHRVHISNKQFGLFERHDDLAVICCMVDDELMPVALRVYNEHNEERDAYIFAQEYLERLGMYMEA